MSYFQATTCKPHTGLIVDRPITGLGKTCRLLPVPQYSLRSRPLGFRKLDKHIYPRLVLVAASHPRLTPVCASSGKGNPEIDNDPFMDHLKKAMADAKKPRPIQDALKEKFTKLREQASGGGGGNGNRRGGNGGSGGPEDESFKESLDEVVQVILATVAFILVYIHIIRGEELYRLARDYTRYLVTVEETDYSLFMMVSLLIRCRSWLVTYFAMDRNCKSHMRTNVAKLKIYLSTWSLDVVGILCIGLQSSNTRKEHGRLIPLCNEYHEPMFQDQLTSS
ncbi:hypothetical protein TRIUR3_16791 [Triticum urartu]|uniref:Uncharacterized protein n=1 Tax=Triticum urartu TaxID=4572 RepID=M8A6V6_TRIUA|nr:hypothetical protein TRIUR3_16791 [Triticum urartu]